MLMKSAYCDLWLSGGCGPREWVKFQKVSEPKYRFKIYEFKKRSPHLELIPTYKGTGNGTSLRRHSIYACSPRMSLLLRSLRRGI